MAVPVHTELKQIAGNLPAAYISLSVLDSLSESHLLAGAFLLKNKEIPTGMGLLSASLIDAGFAGFSSPVFEKFPTALPNQIALRQTNDLKIKVLTFIRGDSSKIISTIDFTISRILIYADADDNMLIFHGADYHPSYTITRSTNASSLLTAAAVDPLEAARVEGHIAYGVVTSAISANLSQRREFSLSKLFPAFDFGRTLTLHPLVSGSYLGIIPASDYKINTKNKCDCALGPDLSASGSDAKAIAIPPNPVAGTPIGKVTLGGPVPEHIDPMTDLGRRPRGEAGIAGLYLQRSAYTSLTVDVMPAILVHASDNGFIGFDARATVGFSGFNVQLDPANGGIIVGIHMDISVQATCTMDMGKGIRLPIGEALINPTTGSNAYLELGFYPAADKSGNILLKGILQNVDMGTYTAIIIGVGTALELLGVTSWVGFLIDVVLSAIISREFPAVLTDEIKKYIGSNEWKLIDARDLLKLLQPFGGEIFTAPFDVDGDTMLVSIYNTKA